MDESLTNMAFHDLGIGPRSDSGKKPRFLFKYLSPDRLDVVLNHRLRFTQPVLLNDPFDSRPLFKRSPRIVKPLGWWDEPETVWDDPDSFTFAKYLRTCVRALEDIRPIIRRDARREFLLDGLGEVTGILSLSEDPAHPLMWAHYCSAHQGFVVGFDTSNEFFRCASRPQNRPGPIAPIRYTNERPYRSSYSRVTAQDLFTKSDHWAYEREWRRYELIENADNASEHKGNWPLALFSYPAEAIAYVIFGMDMESDRKRRLLAPFLWSNRVQFFQAEMDARYYRFRFRRVDMKNFSEL